MRLPGGRRLRTIGAIGLIAVAAAVTPDMGVRGQAEAQAEEVLLLHPGHARMVRISQGGGASVFIADSGVADVSLIAPDAFMVFGVGVGETLVAVHDEEGGTRWKRLVRVVEKPPGLYEEGVQDAVESLTGVPDITVRAAGGQYVIEGTAWSPLEAERALRALESRAGDAPVVNLLRLRGPVQVNLEVMISEVSRNVTERLGIDWSVSLSPAGITEALGGALTGVRLASGGFQIVPVLVQATEVSAGTEDAPPTRTVTIRQPDPVERQPVEPGGLQVGLTGSIDSGRRHVNAFLEALARNGLATIHAQPNLTVISGQKAKFFSGTKIPIPRVGDQGRVGVTYEEVGVDVEFTPTVLDDQRIALDVSSRLRERGDSVNVLGSTVSDLEERSVETNVEVGDGESIAVAGLYRRAGGTTTSGIPLLSELPLWGHLFKRTEKRDEVNELVIVVTPRIVTAVQGDPSVLVGDARPPLSVPGLLRLHAEDGAALSVFQY